jgi:hypothetical protein
MLKGPASGTASSSARNLSNSRGGRRPDEGREDGRHGKEEGAASDGAAGPRSQKRLDLAGFLRVMRAQLESYTQLRLSSMSETWAVTEADFSTIGALKHLLLQQARLAREVHQHILAHPAVAPPLPAGDSGGGRPQSESEVAPKTPRRRKALLPGRLRVATDSEPLQPQQPPPLSTATAGGRRRAGGGGLLSVRGSGSSILRREGSAWSTDGSHAEGRASSIGEPRSPSRDPIPDPAAHWSKMPRAAAGAADDDSQQSGGDGGGSGGSGSNSTVPLLQASQLPPELILQVPPLASAAAAARKLAEAEEAAVVARAEAKAKAEAAESCVEATDSEAVEEAMDSASARGGGHGGNGADAALDLPSANLFPTPPASTGRGGGGSPPADDPPPARPPLPPPPEREAQRRADVGARVGPYSSHPILPLGRAGVVVVSRGSIGRALSADSGSWPTLPTDRLSLSRSPIRSRPPGSPPRPPLVAQLSPRVWHTEPRPPMRPTPPPRELQPPPPPPLPSPGRGSAPLPPLPNEPPSQASAAALRAARPALQRSARSPTLPGDSESTGSASPATIAGADLVVVA